MYPATTGAKQRMIITENYHYRCDHLPRWHLAGRALALSVQFFDEVVHVYAVYDGGQRGG